MNCPTGIVSGSLSYRWVSTLLHMLCLLIFNYLQYNLLCVYYCEIAKTRPLLTVAVGSELLMKNCPRGFGTLVSCNVVTNCRPRKGKFMYIYTVNQKNTPDVIYGIFYNFVICYSHKIVYFDKT